MKFCAKSVEVEGIDTNDDHGLTAKPAKCAKTTTGIHRVCALGGLFVRRTSNDDYGSRTTDSGVDFVRVDFTFIRVKRD